MMMMTMITQKWEWRKVKKPENGGEGAFCGPRWGLGALTLVGGEGGRVRGQSPLKQKAFSTLKGRKQKLFLTL